MARHLDLGQDLPQDLDLPLTCAAFKLAVDDLQKRLLENEDESPEPIVKEVLDLAKKTICVVGDKMYSSLWIVLLDWLVRLRNTHEADVSEIYRCLNDIQSKVYDEKADKIPSDVLERLWLTHLPSLEYAVLRLVQRCTQTSSPFEHIWKVDELLELSGLTKIASHESMVYSVICQMLETVLKNAGLSVVLVNLLAKFHVSVRQSPFYSRADGTIPIRDRSPSYATLHGLFSSLTQGFSQKSDTEAISRMFMSWSEWRNTLSNPALCHDLKSELRGEETDDVSSAYLHKEDYRLTACAEGTVKNETEENITAVRLDALLDEVWLLTIKYQSWTVAALNSILVCDTENVDSCLWLIVTRARLDFHSDDFSVARARFVSLVKELRNLMDKNEIWPTLGPLLSELTMALHAADMHSKSQSAKAGKYRTVYQQVMMVFLFQSHCVHDTSAWENILRIVTKSTEASIHLACILYYFHLLKPTALDWDTKKKKHFRYRLDNLVEKLSESEAKSNTKGMFSDLSKMNELLK